MNEESLFRAVLAQPDSGARAHFLDEACAGKPELRGGRALLRRMSRRRAQATKAIV